MNSDYDRTRHRHDDALTSIEGALAVGPRAGSQKARLLDAYRAAGEDGLTPNEAAVAAGLPLTSCYWKRVGELERDGWIEPTGVIRPGSAGSYRRVHRAVTQSRLF